MKSKKRLTTQAGFNVFVSSLAVREHDKIFPGFSGTVSDRFVSLPGCSRFDLGCSESGLGFSMTILSTFRTVREYSGIILGQL